MAMPWESNYKTSFTNNNIANYCAIPITLYVQQNVHFHLVIVKTLHQHCGINI